MAPRGSLALVPIGGDILLARGFRRGAVPLLLAFALVGFAGEARPAGSLSVGSPRTLLEGETGWHEGILDVYLGEEGSLYVLRALPETPKGGVRVKVEQLSHDGRVLKTLVDGVLAADPMGFVRDMPDAVYVHRGAIYWEAGGELRQVGRDARSLRTLFRLSSGSLVYQRGESSALVLKRATRHEALAFRGAEIVSLQSDGVRFYRLSDGRPLRSLQLPGNRPSEAFRSSIQVTASGETFISLSEIGEVLRFHGAHAKPVRLMDDPLPLDSFHHPFGVAVHPSGGTVYVADTENRRIVVVGGDGTPLREIPVFGPLDPNHIAADEEGRVFFSGLGLLAGGEMVEGRDAAGNFLRWIDTGIYPRATRRAGIEDLVAFQGLIDLSVGGIVEEWDVLGHRLGSWASPCAEAECRTRLARDREGQTWVLAGEELFSFDGRTAKSRGRFSPLPGRITGFGFGSGGLEWLAFGPKIRTYRKPGETVREGNLRVEGIPGFSPQVAVPNPGGGVWALDPSLGCVVSFDEEGAVRARVGCAPSKRSLWRPQVAGVAPDGSVLVADLYNQRLVRFAPGRDRPSGEATFQGVVPGLVRRVLLLPRGDAVVVSDKGPSRRVSLLPLHW